MQGDTWASTMASVQCDNFGKELLEKNVPYLYKYKGCVPIGILGQIDDLIAITDPGYKAHQMNQFINVKTANKNLQFGPDKCKTMLVGSKKNKFDFLHTKLSVNTWSTTHNEEGQLIETYQGKSEMEEVNNIKYLGVLHIL